VRNSGPSLFSKIASWSDFIYLFLAMRIPFFLAVFFTLLGRSYQYLFWDAPVRTLIWDESLMTRTVKLLTGQSWQEFAANINVNSYIRIYSIAVGILFLCAAVLIVAVLNGSRRKWYWIPIVFSSCLLFFHSMLEMKDKFYHIAQLLEPSIQIFAPIIFMLWMYKKIGKNSHLKIILKILVAITFAAHGLYAMGFYPVPGHFIDMTILSLGISEDQSRMLLFIVGWLDIALVVALFVPALEKVAIWYAIVWGFLTALARIWSGFDVDFFWSSLHQHSYRTLFRLSHGLVPLTIYLIIQLNNNVENTTIEA